MNSAPQSKAIGASFRDPDGYILVEEGVFRRVITPGGKPSYDGLMQTGLYDCLTAKGYLLSHREIATQDSEEYKRIEPEQIPFISYPYEWAFSQLRAAALLTLKIQLEALERDVSLKDATPYNIQFIGTQPVFIDTLSFEPNPGGPWVAYRQFCENFLAPLALMAYRHYPFNRYLQVDFHGLDLRLCSQLLPRRTFFRPSLLMHIHLHSKSQARFKDDFSTARQSKEFRLSKTKQMAIIHSLINAVEGLKPPFHVSTWSDYYKTYSYSDAQQTIKIDFIKNALEKIHPDLVFDLGGNTGRFSELATERGSYAICMDQDERCVEMNFLYSQKRQDRRMLPLVIDLSNPSPGIGWNNQERLPIWQRKPSDCTIALALIHHLRIGNNLPLDFIAEFLRDLSPHLLIEFIGKSDPQVQKLLSGRKDIFTDYTCEHFEKIFGNHYTILKREPISDTDRVLFHLKRKKA